MKSPVKIKENENSYSNLPKRERGRRIEGKAGNVWIAVEKSTCKIRGDDGRDKWSIWEEVGQKEKCAGGGVRIKKSLSFSK